MPVFVDGAVAGHVADAQRAAAILRREKLRAMGDDAVLWNLATGTGRGPRRGRGQRTQRARRAVVSHAYSNPADESGGRRQRAATLEVVLVPPLHGDRTQGCTSLQAPEGC